MTKESLHRLRTILIENFSNTAPPQVEVAVTTPADAIIIPVANTTITPETIDSAIAAPYETTVTPVDTTTGNTNNSNNNTIDMDLTADVDTWCLCGLPNDGRTNVQCSREDRYLGAKNGWFHGECLQTAGWSKPRRSQKNWLCQSCHVFENGI